MKLDILAFGAHPDDADLVFGGTALKLIAAGHKVKFVSVANGDCGHFSMKPAELAKRRYEEAQASAKIAGLTEYQILPNSDCTLEASLENREQVVSIIREFKPDVVISHRINDYHADHRATAQLVQGCFISDNGSVVLSRNPDT
jgi:LmbE family N-acetylglucosaminyl deacetylase